MLHTIYSIVLVGTMAFAPFDEGAGGGGPQQTDSLQIYLEQAQQGDAEAQCKMGTICLKGEFDAPKDTAKAVEWYRMSAEQGFPKAQRIYGFMHFNGIGVTVDYQEAFKWCLAAAEQGDVYAQAKVAYMYYKGIGPTQNEEEAAKWFLKAAQQGDAESQNQVGIMYEEGKVFQQDNEEAIRWYRMAAEQGYTDGIYNLAIEYYKGKMVPKDYTEALKWVRQAIEKESEAAMNLLAIMYENGEGVPQSVEEAIKWYRKSVQYGDAYAASNMALNYYSGDKMTRNYDSAFYYANIAYERNEENLKACRLLGVMYYYGEGTVRNFEKAKYYLNRVELLQGKNGMSEGENVNDYYTKLKKELDAELKRHKQAIEDHAYHGVPDMQVFFQTGKKSGKQSGTTNKSLAKDLKKVKAKKPEKQHKPNVYDKFFDHSGFYSLSYLSVGYMYYFMGQEHHVNASILDFRLSVVGVSPLCVELCANPWQDRVTYKPTVQVYFPVAKCFSLVPYAGVAVDASYVGTFFNKNYAYDKDKDFYIAAVGGLALDLSAMRHVPIQVKLEYRHPLVQPVSGTTNLTGLYLGAQIKFGSIWDKKKMK